MSGFSGMCANLINIQNTQLCEIEGLNVSCSLEGLFETRVKENKVHQIVSSVFQGW